MGLIFLPLRLALKLVKLPFTIMGCITKLACLVVVGIVIAIIVVILVLVFR